MLLEDLLKEVDKARLEAGVPRMVLCLVIPEFVDFLEDIDLVSDWSSSSICKLNDELK